MDKFYSVHRENISVDDLAQKITETRCGTILVHGGSGTGKRSILEEIARNIQAKERFSRHLFSLHVGKIETVMELLTLIDHIGHDILYDVFGKSDNVYRPENIEDWVMYIKSNSPLSEIVLFLDDVCDQFVIDVFSLLRIKLVISSSNSDINVQNMCAFVHIDDFSVADSLKLVEQVTNRPSDQFPRSLQRLLSDISRSPLEVRMIAVLLKTATEPIDKAIDRLVMKRVEVASAMVQQMDISDNDDERPSHAPSLSSQASAAAANTSPLLTRVMPRVSTSPLTSSDDNGRRAGAEQRDSGWWEERMRRVSIYITLQLVLESLPENIQVKYVLLGVVPAAQPVSLSLLRFLWKLDSNEEVMGVTRVLVEWGLMRVDRSIIETADNPQMFILHSLQHDYLYALLSLPIWHNRAQLAANRLAEFLTNPSLRSEEDVFFDTHVHKERRGEVDTSFPSTTFIRIGLYFRKVQY
jgi:hypothetical protein